MKSGILIFFSFDFASLAGSSLSGFNDLSAPVLKRSAHQAKKTNFIFSSILLFRLRFHQTGG
jgi:hypothetical protein